MGRLLPEVPGLDIMVETDAVGAAELSVDFKALYITLMLSTQTLAGSATDFSVAPRDSVADVSRCFSIAASMMERMSLTQMLFWYG